MNSSYNKCINSVKFMLITLIICKNNTVITNVSKG